MLQVIAKEGFLLNLKNVAAMCGEGNVLNRDGKYYRFHILRVHTKNMFKNDKA